jgi:hypothetical protein
MSDPMDWWTPTSLHLFLYNRGIPQPRFFNDRNGSDISYIRRKLR